MRKILIWAAIVLAALWILLVFFRKQEEHDQLQESSKLIEQQLVNVGKLIVTEGHFAEVYNYKDSRQLFGSLISADKKALVVVNAEVSVVYDLRKLSYELDTENRTVYLRRIPDPEIKINPDFEYYDVQADFLNPFDGDDYNAIKNRVNKALLEKIRKSNLMSNSRNRLLSELSGILILTNTMNWTLTYEERKVDSVQQFLIPH